MRLSVTTIALLVISMTPALCTEAPPAEPKQLIQKLLSVTSPLSGPAEWSPDGLQILFASTVRGTCLWGVSPKGDVPKPIGGTGDCQIPSWSPDSKWVAYMSSQSGSPELWLHSTVDGREQQLTHLGARINAFAWSPNAKWIAFSADRYGAFDIWKVSISDGTVYRLTSSSSYAISPSWTPDSEKVLYVESDDAWANHDIYSIPADGGRPRLLVRDRDWFDYGTIWTNSSFGAPIVSPDNSTVLFRSYRSGWINYWSVPINGGEPNALAPESADQSDARWSPDGLRLVYLSNHNGTVSLRMLRKGERNSTTLFEPQAGVAGSPSWSPDGKQISYTLATLHSPAELFVLPLSDKHSRQITHLSPEYAIGDPDKISYKSTSNLNVSAYLYKPPDMAAGKKYPAILWIHGGPTSQFLDTFFPLAQFFAAQGYVVLAPNIRGSSGYGRQFEDANKGCWGHCDLEDVVAGAHFLQALPYIDPDNIGITGTSYGGCMSMSAAAFAPGVFQAAIPMSGYGDWVSFMTYNTEIRHTKLLAYELGPYPERESVYRYVSPIYSVKNITTPMFLIQGGGPITSWRPGEDQPPASLEFARALEEAYKVYRYKVYVNDTEPSHYGPYYVSGFENTSTMALDMLDFFNLYLKSGFVRLESTSR
jgi:dipeptidyl aminopeptidase/acylaminoacyl peptidase